jgi:hypothetical protein
MSNFSQGLQHNFGAEEILWSIPESVYCFSSNTPAIGRHRRRHPMEPSQIQRKLANLMFCIHVASKKGLLRQSTKSWKQMAFNKLQEICVHKI